MELVGDCPELKPRVYVESTVISNLTARPSNVWMDKLYQDATKAWWMRAEANFQLVTGTVAIMEISMGDPAAVESRLQAVKEMPVCEVNEEIERIAENLLTRLAVPKSQWRDALHIATASYYRIPYLLSWNFKHIVNPVTRPIIRKVLEDMGHFSPEICTPLDMLGGEVNAEE